MFDASIAAAQPSLCVPPRLPDPSNVRGRVLVIGVGCTYANRRLTLGDTQWNFDGQKIFRCADHGMGEAAAEVMKKCGVTPDQVDLVVLHQANLRIIEAVGKRAGIPMDKVMLTVQCYGNMSSATVPVALRHRPSW